MFKTFIHIIIIDCFVSLLFILDQYSYEELFIMNLWEC